ncbi:hypothetical protein QYF61_002070 [Mycteria americana]|uniref:Uncharacterized protein n=1 Tax=Mycteria americana TaxID=33587 RepID=A0AAN7MTJ3_MYCAM|nr:hypothetical protein QYF61_002070 [Mycteria americana]
MLLDTSFCQKMLNNPRSLSHSPSALCSRPFPSSVALLWTRSSPSMSLWEWGAQH